MKFKAFISCQVCCIPLSLHSRGTGEREQKERSAAPEGGGGPDGREEVAPRGK